MIKYLQHLGYVVLAVASAPLFIVGVAVFAVYMLGVSFCRLIEALLESRK